MLGAAALAVANGDAKALDAIPAAIYATDADGRVTWFNRACVDFAGRVPNRGKDRWCISWRLYAQDGIPMAHDECPMAQTLRTQRPIRGGSAIAERPDGSRIPFQTYATPLFDTNGVLTGGINLLLDLTDEHQARALREQAARCRRLANTLGDRVTILSLETMAEEYDDQAMALEQVA